MDPSLGTVQHSKPVEDGKHLTTSLYVKVIKLLTKILCALLLMAGQNHLWYWKIKINNKNFIDTHEL